MKFLNVFLIENYRMAVIIFLLIFVNAHRDTLNFGNSCMDDFRDSKSAFLVPNAEVSWMLSHYYDCHSEAVWFEFKNPAENWDKMYFGAGVIIADRFKEARVHAIMIGPDLPTPLSEVQLDIPDQIKNDGNMTNKVTIIVSTHLIINS